MHLTKEEEHILDGKLGEGYARMMKILVKIGEIYGAEKLIPIKSAQISGVSYNTIGEYGLHFLRSLKGVKVSVPTTLNPLGFDSEHLSEMSVDEKFYKKQMEIIKAYLDMGIKPTATCTPYYYDNIPSFGDHIAWAESSAVIYANSIIGARTNREGAITALASAVIGKTPLYGLHLNENRHATHIIRTDFELKPVDFPLLGIHIGKIIDSGIPYFRIKGTQDDLKLLGAALAASGSIAMYHVENITPEWQNALIDKVEIINVGREDIEEHSDTVDGELYAIGCPHASPSELRIIAEFLKDKKIKKDAKLWIFTSKSVKREHQELVKIIENAGGVVFTDTCVVVSNAGKIFSKIVTTSGKAKVYLQKKKFGGAKVIVVDIHTLLRSVVE